MNRDMFVHTCSGRKHFILTFCVLVICLSYWVPVTADELQLDYGANGTYLRLKQLQSPASVLHVVAHPDDEDGGMLAYCARQLGVRTMLFSLTRGEGGANLISEHFFDELGALRTLEHTKAASYYGNELFYSRATDYGYSKTLDEAMQMWQRGVPLLEDLVEVIRRERPWIVMSRFAGDPRDGHGHHQMAGVLSRIAFQAAADPGQFPDQLQNGLRPWQAKKLYVRAGSPWRPPAPESWTTELSLGDYDPVLGRSPAQIARFGIGFQRSQGFSGHYGAAGPKSSYYRLERWFDDRKITHETSLFSELDKSWSGQFQGTHHALATELEQRLEAALTQWNPRQPSTLLPDLTQAKRLADQLVSNSRESRDELKRLIRLLDQTILASQGLELEAWAETSEGATINFAIPGEELKISVRVANQGKHKVRVSTPKMVWGDSTQSTSDSSRLVTIQAGDVLEHSEVHSVPRKVPVTRPYWSRADIAFPFYDVASNSNQRALPRPPVLAKVFVHGTDHDNPIELSSPVRVLRKDPELGNLRHLLEFVPDKDIRFAVDNQVQRKGKSSFTTAVVVRNHRKTKSAATIRLELPKSWSCEPASHAVEFVREDEERIVPFEVSMPSDVSEQAFEIGALVQSDHAEFREGFETITARDLGRVNVYHTATQRIQVVDFNVLGDPEVGYIAGSGDRVAESLGSFGISPTNLTESDLAAGDLTRFDVILVGVRAYAVRDDVRTHNARLLDYVRRGGVLIVQYQTPEFDYNFGPYPYDMGRSPEEVSEELAQVTILQPKHPVFCVPNSISSADFDGWFEQRGSKFWKSWDAHYQPLLECHDRGQEPQQGGQLIAQFGNGVYVYSAYAWYRQLPRGVPGAYRLFANFLSLPETDLVQR